MASLSEPQSKWNGDGGKHGLMKKCVVLIFVAVVVVASLTFGPKRAEGTSKPNPGSWIQAASDFRFNGNDYKCSRGMYISTGHGCLFCPKGHYCDTVDLSTPKTCSAGTYQNGIGFKACKTCPPGHHCATARLFQATKCAAGSYQPKSGQTSCIVAAPGTFVPSAGQTRSSNCPPGEHQPKSGQTQCKRCAAGEVQPYPGQPHCKCAPKANSNGNVQRTSTISITSLNKLTHLANTGCPGAQFVFGNFYYVGSSVSCKSKISTQNGKRMSTGLEVTVGSDLPSYTTPTFRISQDGNRDGRFRVHGFRCSGHQSCHHYFNHVVDNLKLVFDENEPHKRFVSKKAVPYAEALSWAQAGFAPMFRVKYPYNNPSEWWYFNTYRGTRIPKSSNHNFYVAATSLNVGTYVRVWLDFKPNGDVSTCYMCRNTQCYHVHRNSVLGGWFRCDLGHFQFYL